MTVKPKNCGCGRAPSMKWDEEADEWDGSGLFYACGHCNVQGQRARSEEMAAGLWNSGVRVPPPHGGISDFATSEHEDRGMAVGLIGTLVLIAGGLAAWAVS